MVMICDACSMPGTYGFGMLLALSDTSAVPRAVWIEGLVQHALLWPVSNLSSSSREPGASVWLNACYQLYHIAELGCLTDPGRIWTLTGLFCPRCEVVLRSS